MVRGPAQPPPARPGVHSCLTCPMSHPPAPGGCLRPPRAPQVAAEGFVRHLNLGLSPTYSAQRSAAFRWLENQPNLSRSLCCTPDHVTALAECLFLESFPNPSMSPAQKDQTHPPPRAGPPLRLEGTEPCPHISAALWGKRKDFDELSSNDLLSPLVCRLHGSPG